MRVVGGRLRGRPLSAPASRAIRPTSERLRETIFDILAARYAETLEGARVLDLFAGSGALGIEALSRGADFALFVDNGAEARALLRAMSRRSRSAASRESGAPTQPNWAAPRRDRHSTSPFSTRPMARASPARRWRRLSPAAGCALAPSRLLRTAPRPNLRRRRPEARRRPHLRRYAARISDRDA